MQSIANTYLSPNVSLSYFLLNYFCHCSFLTVDYTFSGDTSLQFSPFNTYIVVYVNYVQFLINVVTV